jgi:hypothetical protein
MTYQDPTNPRPQLPPDVDPLAPGANPPLYRDIDRTGNWNTGIIVAAVVALLVVMALILWPGPTDQQTANNPPAQTTGQGGQDAPPPRIAR